MPTPKQGESQKDYVDRCIPIVLNEGTAKDGSQASAICHSMFAEHHKKESMNTEVEKKYCSMELKDLSEEKGIVSFYFSPFNTPDAVGDEATPTAFDKTFSESKKRIKHLRNHEKKEVPGVITELGKDSKGAFAVSQLAIKTNVGRDTFEQYKAGIITEHSYGFIPIKTEKKATAGRILKELRVMEVSSLTAWGCSEHTPVRSIKSLEDAVEYLQRINEILTKGDISDKLGEKFLAEYKILTTAVNEYDIMKMAGVANCPGCGKAIGKMPADQKCPECGQFINKVASKSIDFEYLVNNLRKG